MVIEREWDVPVEVCLPTLGQNRLDAVVQQGNPFTIRANQEGSTDGQEAPVGHPQCNVS